MEDIQNALEKERRKLYGFPLNFSFTDYAKIWEEIESTGVHEILSEDYDFICAVDCFEYPSYVNK